MKKNYQEMPLSKLDDIFTTEQERQDSKLEKIIDIDLDKIDDFSNHPFKVMENEEMEKLTNSINDNGVLVPALVREKENGRYEMISGHRRKMASILANKKTIPCIVRNLSDDEAIIIMVDSNMQREHILPSEKAFAYKMKLEAMKRQGARTDLTSAVIRHKLTSIEKLAKDSNDGKTKIKDLIRLTYLIKPLLDMVDNENMAFSPAVKISFLSNEEQQWLLDSINKTLATPSLSQAHKMKILSQNGELNKYKINEILSIEKPNQIEQLKIDVISLRSKMPKNIPMTRYKEYIFKALDFYNKHLERKCERDR